MAGRFAVDSADVELPEVAPLGDLLLWDRPGYRPRLLQNILRKLVRDVVRANQDFDVDAKVVRTAQNFDDAPCGPLAVVAIIEDFGGDDHSVQVFFGMHSHRTHAHTVYGPTAR